MKLKNKIIRLRKNDPYIKSAQIARELNVSRSYVTDVLKKNNLDTVAEKPPERYKECITCSELILPSLAFKGSNRSVKFFCNYKCYDAYANPTLICKACGKQFQRSRKRIKQNERNKLEGTYCSDECYQIGRVPVRPPVDVEPQRTDIGCTINELLGISHEKHEDIQKLHTTHGITMNYTKRINENKYLHPYFTEGREEFNLRKLIIKHFDKFLIFKNLKVLDKEVRLPNTGRIDILLQNKLNNKLVPVELKFKGESKLRSQIMTYINHLKETQGYTLNNKDYHGLDCERGIIITGDVRYAVDISLVNDPVDVYEWDIDEGGLNFYPYESMTKIVSYCFDQALMENKAYKILKDAVSSGEELNYAQLGKDLFKNPATKKTIGRLFAADFENSV